MKKISVVVGTRNRDDNLNYFIPSLLNQDFDKDSYEVIIVNYGGGSSTKTLVDDFKSPVIKYVYVDETGIYNEGRAKNIGIRQATGEIIVCTNADIIFSPGVLKEFFRIYREKGEKILYQIERYNLNDDTQLDLFINDVIKKIAVSDSFSRWGKAGQGDFQATHRDNWFNVRGYDERMTGWSMMDIDLSTRMKMTDISQYWIDSEKTKIFHQFHELSSPRPPRQKNINRELYRLNNVPVVNNASWGLVDRTKKCFLVINSDHRNSGIESIIQEIGNPEETEYRAIEKKTTCSNRISGPGSRIHICEYKNTRDFFQRAGRLALEHGADIVIEVDRIDDSTGKRIMEGIKMLETHDCIFISSGRQDPVLTCFSRAIFGFPSYYSIRILNSRLAMVLCHKKLYSSDYFYAGEEYYFCHYYGQRIQEIAADHGSAFIKSRIRIFIELLQIVFNKGIAIILEKGKSLIKRISRALRFFH